MAVPISEFAKIAKARHNIGMPTNLSFGETNEISALYDRTKKTDCANFDREIWQCKVYGWNFCLRMLSGECGSFKEGEMCKNCRFAMNPKYRRDGGELITIYECEQKNFTDVCENNMRCEQFENKRCYAKGSCQHCYDDCKNHERCSAVGSNKCEHCFVNQCKEYDAEGEE